ncbi:MAG: endonuclease NucS [Desulfurococcales archaeon]|nr:endonuclease NucS [Desulfurococcales archaeon]
MNVELFDRPSLEKAALILSSATSLKSWVSFGASCQASYEGRSASSFTKGDVIAMIKADGSFIVHGPRGFKPLNWQPSGSLVSVSKNNDSLVLRVVRREPREVLLLSCDQVYFIAVMREPVESEFWFYVNEAEIRDYLASNPEVIEDGLRIVRVEKPVDPGFIDLYAEDSRGNLVVVEIKRVKAGIEAVKQLERYLEHFKARNVRVRGILVAPEATQGAIALMAKTGIEYRRIDLRRIYESVKSRKLYRGKKIDEYLNVQK